MKCREVTNKQTQQKKRCNKNAHTTCTHPVYCCIYVGTYVSWTTAEIVSSTLIKGKKIPKMVITELYGSLLCPPTTSQYNTPPEAWSPEDVTTHTHTMPQHPDWSLQSRRCHNRALRLSTPQNIFFAQHSAWSITNAHAHGISRPRRLNSRWLCGRYHSWKYSASLSIASYLTNRLVAKRIKPQSLVILWG